MQDYEAITNTAFETSYYKEHEDHTVERNAQGLSMVHSTGGVKHAGIKGDGFVDVVSKSLFYPITGTVTINGTNYVVSKKSIIDWNYENGKLYYQLCSSFRERVKLLSGTPVYNEKGQLCS